MLQCGENVRELSRFKQFKETRQKSCSSSGEPREIQVLFFSKRVVLVCRVVIKGFKEATLNRTERNFCGRRRRRRRRGENQRSDRLLLLHMVNWTRTHFFSFFFFFALCSGLQLLWLLYSCVLLLTRVNSCNTAHRVVQCTRFPSRCCCLQFWMNDDVSTVWQRHQLVAWLHAGKSKSFRACALLSNCWAMRRERDVVAVR